MSGKNVNFGDKKINKSNFSKSKKLFKVHDIDTNKILVSKKESYGTKKSLKYFIGYNDNDVIRQLYIKISQMIGMLNVLIVIKQCLLKSAIKTVENVHQNMGKSW